MPVSAILGALLRLAALGLLLQALPPWFAHASSLWLTEPWLAIALPLASAIGAMAWVASWRWRQPASRWRTLLNLLAIAWLAGVIWLQPWSELAARFAFACAVVPWCLLAAQRPSPPRPAWRRLDLLATNLIATVVLTEIALRAVPATSLRMLCDGPSTPAAVVARQKLAPGTLWFGDRINSLGFPDDEFVADAAPRIALIGDSFGLGVVPRDRHYAALCERELGVPIDNLGVPGADLREYAWLLEHVALPLAPTAVVVTVYLGNDLATMPAEVPWLRRSCAQEHSALANLLRRLSLLRQQGSAIAPITGTSGDQAWFADWRLEPPTMTDAAYADLLQRKLAQLLRADARTLATHVHTLETMRQACQPAPFAVVLIPDELQVEDALWQAFAARNQVAERWRAQTTLVGACAAAGIPCLDLAPVLLASPAEHDGQRHVFHRNDTHFNVRGNAAAAAAMTPFLRSVLASARVSGR